VGPSKRPQLVFLVYRLSPNLLSMVSSAALKRARSLGHSSKAVHRAYTTRALLKIPSLEEYAKRAAQKETAISRAFCSTALSRLEYREVKRGRVQCRRYRATAMRRQLRVCVWTGNIFVAGEGSNAALWVDILSKYWRGFDCDGTPPTRRRRCAWLGALPGHRFGIDRHNSGRCRI